MKTTLLIQISAAITLTMGLNAQDFNEVFRTAASDGEMGENFGHSVSLSGNTAIVGAYHDSKDENGSDSLHYAGSAYFFERDGYGNWHEIQKVVASDRSANDLFGLFVSISGNYAIVGVPWADSDETGGNTRISAGSAYIFERAGNGTWHEVQKIVASDRAENDYFGSPVAVSGNYALIGANKEDDDASGTNALSDAGSAYIFERDNNGNWNQVQKVVATDRDSNDCFGSSLAVSGEYAIVGAYYEDEDGSYINSLECSGSAYIFKRDNTGIWKEIQKIVASDRSAYDLFGNSIDISGTSIIVGAFSEEEDMTGDNTMVSAGSAYIFEDDGTGAWKEVQKLVASDRAEFDLFGIDVSLSGYTAVVGAYGESEDEFSGNTLSNAGSVYIFKRDNDGIWSQSQKIVASDRAAERYFGVSADISGDYAIIGTNYSGSMTEMVYLFESCSPGGESDTENIIANGDFGSCILSPWQTYVYDPAVNTVNAVLADGECRFSGLTVSNNPMAWHIQLPQTFTEEQKSRLETGATYELSFDAKADTEGKEVYVFFGQNVDPWTACVNETIWVGAEKENFSFEFTLTSVLQLMRILFGVGHDPAGLTIDNVRLVKKTVNADQEGIKKSLVENTPIVYPNPVSDVIDIFTTDPVTITLFNSLGVSIRMVTTPETGIRIPVHDLPDGLYFLEVRKKQYLSVHRIIVKH